jgi:hypothetical protein
MARTPNTEGRCIARLQIYDDPGWYENPPGTLASLANNDELQRDLGELP